MKKGIIAILISVNMFILSSCGDNTQVPVADEPPQEKVIEEQKSEDTGIIMLPDRIEPGVNIVATPELYSKIDLSRHETVKMLLVGDTPNDWDEVLGLANDYLSDFNTTLDVDFIQWADWNDDYAKTINSSTYDLVFTAPWCLLYSEAAKGTFYTLDTKFAGSYMPLTYKYQVSESWDETTIMGSTVAIPSNTMDTNGKMVAIRQDYADELGISELTCWDDYMDYMLRVAEEITPKTGVYAMAAEGENKELWDQYRQQYDTFYALESDLVTLIYSYDGEMPEYEDIEFTYETEMFKDYCHDMKTLFDAGAWSGSAQYGSTSDDDAFANLEGASISWNKSVFRYVEIAEENEGVECGIYFLTPDNLISAEAYSNNDMAILASSKRPERAAMVLDLLKCDTYLNHLFILGIEGKHYTIDEEGRYSETDSASDYIAGSVSLAWAIKNGDVSELYLDKREEDILERMDKCKVACPTVTFVFDDSNVANEMIAVNEVLTQELPRLQLGMARDVDSTIERMVTRCYSCGLQLIKDEYKQQYVEWLKTR